MEGGLLGRHVEKQPRLTLGLGWKLAFSECPVSSKYHSISNRTGLKQNLESTVSQFGDSPSKSAKRKHKSLSG